MTQDIEKVLGEVAKDVGMHILFKKGVVKFPKARQALTTTLTKVAEEARKEERERIVEWAKKQKTERKSDPWAYGFNMDMTAGLCEGMNDLIAHLQSDNK